MRTINILLLLLFGAIGVNSYAQKSYTVYYDSNWKGVQNKEFAYHELIYSPSKDTHYRNQFVLKYASGEKEGEGEFVSIDKYDFTKSVLGSYRLFYKNGNKLVEYKLDGEKMDFTSFYPNGLVKDKQTYCNGQLDGICYHFTEDGIGCFQTLYKNGQTAQPYYTYSNKDGYVTKYRTKDNKLYLETPDVNEKKTYEIGGTTYQSYSKNGIILSATAGIGMDYKENSFGGYGKYIIAYIIFTNNTNTPILFDPNIVTGTIIKKGKRTSARLVSKKEYMGEVATIQAQQRWINATKEAKEANAAAYSYATSNTEIYYSGSTTTETKSAAIGAAIGTNGAAVGAAVGASLSKTAYSGEINSSTSSVSYNGAAAYQAKLIAEQRISDYNEQLNQSRTKALESYISKTVVKPGQTISGRVLFDYEKADGIEIRIPVSGIIYTF